MTGTVLDEQDRWPDAPERGTTTLEAFIANAVRQRGATDRHG